MWLEEAGIRDFDDSRCLAFPDSSHVVQAVTEGGAVGLADLAMIANDLLALRAWMLGEAG